MLTSYDWQFRKLWNLAPTDPRFLTATPEEIRLDVWAAYYASRPKDSQETEAYDDEFNLDEILRQAESGDWEDLT